MRKHLPNQRKGPNQSKRPNEIHVSNISDKDFKVKFIRIFTRLEKKVEDISEILHTEINKSKSDIKNTINEIKNTLME